MILFLLPSIVHLADFRDIAQPGFFRGFPGTITRPGIARPTLASCPECEVRVAWVWVDLLPGSTSRLCVPTNSSGILSYRCNWWLTPRNVWDTVFIKSIGFRDKGTGPCPPPPPQELLKQCSHAAKSGKTLNNIEISWNIVSRHSAYQGWDLLQAIYYDYYYYYFEILILLLLLQLHYF